MVLDPNWRVVFANAQAARLVHRAVDEMVGSVLWEQFPESVGTRVEDAYRRAARTQEPERIEAYDDRLGGWFEAQVFPSPDGLTVSFRNIDDRRAADEERASLIAQLTASLSRSRQLLGLTRALAGARTLNQVADLVTAHTRGALGSVFAGIAIMDDDDATLRYVSMAPLPDDVARTWTAFPLDTPVPAADSVRRAEQLLFPDRAAIVAAYPAHRGGPGASGHGGDGDRSVGGLREGHRVADADLERAAHLRRGGTPVPRHSRGTVRAGHRTVPAVRPPAKRRRDLATGDPAATPAGAAGVLPRRPLRTRGTRRGRRR